MTGCSSGTTAEEQGATLARAMKSVQAADEDFFDAAWLGKGQKECIHRRLTADRVRGSGCSLTA